MLTLWAISRFLRHLRDLGQPPQRARAGRVGRPLAFKTPVMTGTCGDRNPNGARLLLDCRWGHDCYSKKSSNRAPRVGNADVLTREERPRMTGQNYYTSRRCEDGCPLGPGRPAGSHLVASPRRSPFQVPHRPPRSRARRPAYSCWGHVRRRRERTGSEHTIAQAETFELVALGPQ